jgi:hypothetical protein
MQLRRMLSRLVVDRALEGFDFETVLLVNDVRARGVRFP